MNYDYQSSNQGKLCVPQLRGVERQRNDEAIPPLAGCLVRL